MSTFSQIYIFILVKVYSSTPGKMWNIEDFTIYSFGGEGLEYTDKARKVFFLRLQPMCNNSGQKEQILREMEKNSIWAITGECKYRIDYVFKVIRLICIFGERLILHSFCGKTARKFEVNKEKILKNFKKSKFYIPALSRKNLLCVKLCVFHFIAWMGW